MNTGCPGGNTSGPQSAQMANVAGSLPALRLRPCASSVRRRVASRPEAFLAVTLCDGVPKTARNNPFHCSPKLVVTVRSASRSSAKESADTYVYMVSPCVPCSRIMLAYLRSSSVSTAPPVRAMRSHSTNEKIFSCHAISRVNV